MKKLWWLGVFSIGFLSLAFAGFRIYHSIGIWEYSGEDIVFEIRPGEGFASINGRLYRKGLISSAKVFHRYNQFQRSMTKFKAGKFKISSRSTMMDIVENLTNGKSITFEVTIPEGRNLFEIASILKEKKVIEDHEEFIRLAKNSEVTKKLGIPGERSEGYLYPETYRFTPGSDPMLVLKTMVRQFQKKAKSLDFSKAPVGLNKHQVVILASVVEKETGAGYERPMIAGVFVNRLKKRMRLQSDPTTIYGIYENFNGNLRKKHLLEKTAYNTYKIPALPIGPISNPGLSSLQAVLNPSTHKYLYFVSQNDGTHVFSKNYKDHRAAVDRYQRNRSARKGKSWRDLKKKK